jgi:hypothetical protein
MVAHARNMEGVKQIIRKIIDQQDSAEEIDGVFLVCGEEGSGKSNFMLEFIDLWIAETHKPIDIKSVCVNVKELIFALALKKRSIACLDEGDELNNQNYWDPIAKKLKKVFVVSRARANVCLLSFPNPVKIQGYYKEDRAKGVFFCYKRKHVIYFNRKRFRMVREMISKNNNIKSIDDFYIHYRKNASLIDTVPKYNGTLLEEYKKRKNDNIDKVFEEITKEMGEQDQEETFSLNKTSKILDIPRATLMKHIKEGGFTFETNATGNIGRLTQKDIDTLRDYLKTKKTAFLN